LTHHATAAFWRCYDALAPNVRALAADIEDGILWFWIGTHAEYDQLVG